MNRETQVQIGPSQVRYVDQETNISRDVFAHLRQRVQGMQTYLGDLAARVRGLNTPERDSQRAELVLNRQFQVSAEFEARSYATGAPTDVDFRQKIAERAASRYIEDQYQTYKAIDRAYSTNPDLDNLVRGYYQGALLRMVLGAVAFGVGRLFMEGNASVTAQEAGLIFGGAGLVDTIRQEYLMGQVRNAAGLAGLPLRELKRRWASITEGRITGDSDLPQAQTAIEQELTTRLRGNIQNNLDADNVTRPPLILHDPAWVESLRSPLQAALSGYDLMPEFMRAQRVARRGRLLRTGALALAILGTIVSHQGRTNAENCGVRTYTGPDMHSQANLGTNDPHYISGAAKAEVYEQVFQEPFDHTPKQHARLAAYLGMDDEGNRLYVGMVGDELLRRSPNLELVGPDAFRGNLVRLCSGDFQRINREVRQELSSRR